VSFILRIVDLSSVLVILFDSEDEEEVDVGTVAVAEVGYDCFRKRAWMRSDSKSLGVCFLNVSFEADFLRL